MRIRCEYFDLADIRNLKSMVICVGLLIHSIRVGQSHSVSKAIRVSALPLFDTLRNISYTALGPEGGEDGAYDDDEVDLSEYMHGRRGRERKDSVDDATLSDRRRHRERIDSIEIPRDDQLVRKLINSGFGSKKRLANLYAQRLNKRNRPSVIFVDEDDDISAVNEMDGNEQVVGAGGFATHLASASSDWPLFKHMLPEIAMAGHSNAGKVNAYPSQRTEMSPVSVITSRIIK